jgi:polyisoprenoid-binding protein YceI
MKHCILFVMLMAVVPSPAWDSTVWEIDPATTNVGFSITLLLIKRVPGRFERVGGTVTLAEDLQNSTVEVTIDPASISTEHKKRDRHLRSRDFFDVDRHPTMTFRSTNVARGADGQWRLTGNLTIRGHTRPVILDVEPVTPVAALREAERIRARATAKINRRDFGLTYSSMALGNEVDISIDVEVVKQTGVVPE